MSSDSSGGRQRWRNPWLWAALAVSLLFFGFLLNQLLDGADRLQVFAQDVSGWAYVVVGLLVFLDGICALFPAETTLNTATALAVQGQMHLGWIMVAGAVGAVTGDSALYWMARFSRTRFQRQLDRALANDKVAAAMDVIGTSTPLLLCAGRYAPGLRFVVNASCGLAPYPYRRFLLWSAIGGTGWSIVTCTVAYVVASALEGKPVAAVALSSCVSTVAIAVIFVVVRRRRRAAAAAVETA